MLRDTPGIVTASCSPLGEHKSPFAFLADLHEFGEMQHLIFTLRFLK
jgi:hypothetical protein